MLIPDWRSMGLAQLNMLVHCTVHELRAGEDSAGARQHLGVLHFA